MVRRSNWVQRRPNLSGLISVLPKSIDFTNQTAYNITIAQGSAYTQKEVSMKAVKMSLVAVAVGLTMAGCSTTKNSNPDEQIRFQKLSTSFVSEKIKIETDCAWYKVTKTDCDIVAIEAVGTAPTFGSTVNNRKNALTIAEMRAGAHVSEFLSKEITSTRVASTLAKSIEKASDKVRSGKADNSTVETTDTEPGTGSVRENTNDTAVQLTETIKTSSKAILKGFVKVKEEVVGDQEVAVTIRWDRDSQRTATQLRKLLGS